MTGSWRLKVLLTSLALLIYFASHMYHGRHGLEANSRLSLQLRVLDRELGSLEAVRTGLERDVALLSPDKPDPDIVDQIARDVLGLVRPEDVVVVH
ncbi:MAG: septum formation initiator family protein [Hyphomicrobiaceae bacterium]